MLFIYICWVSAIKICEKNHWDFLVYWIYAIFLLIFSNRIRFWGSGTFVVPKRCHYSMVEAESNLKLLPPFILDISKVFECIGMLSNGIQSALNSYLTQVLGFRVTYGVKMMSLHHGWGWQTPQNASHSHIRHIHGVWAHWYAFHMHIVAALHSYTHPNWLRIWGSWSLVESKWCCYVIVDADSHLKLLPIILDIYTVFEGLVWYSWLEDLL